MNWTRVDSARRRARGLLVVGGALTFVGVMIVVAAPALMQPLFEIPDLVPGFSLRSIAPPIGLVGILVGFAWMVWLYRRPTRYEGAHWRLGDH